MSTKTGFAPRALTALPVATNVNGGRSTSSPAVNTARAQGQNQCIRSGSEAGTVSDAAEPGDFFFQRGSFAPQAKCCDAITRSTVVRISPPIAAYCADRQACGTGSGRGEEIARLCGVAHGAGLASGTDALIWPCARAVFTLETKCSCRVYICGHGKRRQCSRREAGFRDIPSGHLQYQSSRIRTAA